MPPSWWSLTASARFWTTIVLATVATAAVVQAQIWRRRRRLRVEHISQLRKALLSRADLATSDEASVVIVDDLSQWDGSAEERAFINRVRLHPLLGLDCEWVGTGSKLALLQVATAEGSCVLIRLCKTLAVPSSIADILADEGVVKLGVGVQEDATKLTSEFQVPVRGCCDLRHLAVAHRPDLKKLGLAGLAKAFLNIALDKDWRVRSSDWEADTLNPRQVSYAANDASSAVFVALAIAVDTLYDDDSIQSSIPNCIDDVPLAALHLIKPYLNSAFKQKSSSCGPKKNSESPAPSTWNSHRLEKYSIRKSPLYHNVRLEAPDGQALCVCDIKKARWYVSKGLAAIVTEDPLVVRLRFEPAGRPEGKAGEYYLTVKENVCVVCGQQNSYLRKYIVPHEYRKHFPEIMRDHQSHDVLLFCLDCHHQSNLRDLNLRRRLAEQCDAPIGTGGDRRFRDDFSARQVSSAARALLKDKERKAIPSERKAELEDILREYFVSEEITEEILQEGANMAVAIENSGYFPHGRKVVEHFSLAEGGIMQLERMWRQHFLDEMKPRFLPPLWSIDHQQIRLDCKAAENRIDMDSYKLATGLQK